MTSLEVVQQLQDRYGDNWIVRVTHGAAYATRRVRALSTDQLSAGLAMTLYDGDGGSLADLLEKQARIEETLGTNEAEPASSP